MKMKRSEKLGMFTGLVVGVLLLLISVFMIFQTTCKVWGAEKPANATQQGIDVSKALFQHPFPALFTSTFITAIFFVFSSTHARTETVIPKTASTSPPHARRTSLSRCARGTFLSIK